MDTKVLLAIALILGCACSNGTPQSAIDGTPFNTRKATVEGHQYILFMWGHGGGPVHDPVCPNPTHALPAEGR